MWIGVERLNSTKGLGLADPTPQIRSALHGCLIYEAQQDTVSAAIRRARKSFVPPADHKVKLGQIRSQCDRYVSGEAARNCTHSARSDVQFISQAERAASQRCALSSHVLFVCARAAMGSSGGTGKRSWRSLHINLTLCTDPKTRDPSALLAKLSIIARAMDTGNIYFLALGRD